MKINAMNKYGGMLDLKRASRFQIDAPTVQEDILYVGSPCMAGALSIHQMGNFNVGGAGNIHGCTTESHLVPVLDNQLIQLFRLIISIIQKCYILTHV